jgi:hypothetical protein
LLFFQFIILNILILLVKKNTLDKNTDKKETNKKESPKNKSQEKIDNTNKNKTNNQSTTNLQKDKLIIKDLDKNYTKDTEDLKTIDNNIKLIETLKCDNSDKINKAITDNTNESLKSSIYQSYDLINKNVEPETNKNKVQNNFLDDLWDKNISNINNENKDSIKNNPVSTPLNKTVIKHKD